MRILRFLLLALIVGVGSASALTNDRNEAGFSSIATIHDGANDAAQLAVMTVEHGTQLAEGTISQKAREGYMYGLVRPKGVIAPASIGEEILGDKVLTVHRSTGILYTDSVTVEKIAEDSVAIRGFIYDEVDLVAYYNASEGKMIIPCQHVTDLDEGPIWLCALDMDNNVYDSSSYLEANVNASGDINITTSFGFFVTEGSYKGSYLTVGKINYADIFLSNATISLDVITYGGDGSFTTDNRTVTTDSTWAYVNQVSDNITRVSHVYTNAGYGDISMKMTSAGAFEIDPQDLVSYSLYGFFKLYKMTETTSSTGTITVSSSVLSPLEGTYSEGTISTGPWMTGSTSYSVVMNMYESMTITTNATLDFPAAATFNLAGEGTEESPYLITSIEDLRNIAACVNEEVATRTASSDGSYYTVYDGKYFSIANDFDASNPDGQVEPIGTNTVRFAGHLDGGGHTISNFSIRDYAYDYCGLFGSIDATGSVKNITFDSPYITSLGYNVGVLAGYIYGPVDSVNITSGTVLADEGYYAGGLSGKAAGVISNCDIDCDITAYGYIGGITGRNYDDITNCHTRGTLQMTKTEVFAGGISGYCSGTSKDDPLKVTGCSYSGLIYASTAQVGIGGITGMLVNSEMSECYATARLVATNSSSVYVGGLSGTVYCSIIKNCFSSGSVEGANTTECGTLVGHSSEYYSSSATEDDIIGTDISNCYSSAMLSTGSTDSQKGLIGTSTYINVTNCYFDKQIACITDNDTQGLTTSALTSADGISGFDSSVWTFTEGIYPSLTRFAGNNTMNVATSVLALNEGENLSQVKSDFTYKSASSDVAWKAYMNGSYSTEGGYTYTFDNGTGRLNYSQTTDTIFVIGDVASKYYIANVAPIPFEGEGTADSPWLISNKDELETLSAISNDASVTFEGGYFKVTADIDCAGDTIKPICADHSGKLLFLGSFDGDNHTISNMVVTTVAFYEEGSSGTVGEVNPKSDDSYNNGGLFGNVGESGVVKNVIIDSSCLIDVFATGGAIVGTNAGWVENCRNYAPVTVYANEAGGIVGDNAGGTVINCYNEGTVTAGAYDAGGIAGIATSGTIKNCVNTGEIGAKYINSYKAEGKQYTAGGIVGTSTKSTIENVVNAGNVIAPKEVGGIVGSVSATAAAASTITNAVNYGNISSDDLNTVGQIAGDNTLGTYASCYYDSQRCKFAAVSNGAYEGVTQMSTSELTATGIALPDSVWTITEGKYPTITAFADYPAAKLASEAVVLFNDADYATSVRNSATLNNTSTVTWSLAVGEAFAVSGSTLTVTVPESGVANDTIIASAGDVTRVLPVSTLNPDLFDGDGTAEVPYLIKNAADFMALSNFVASSGYEYLNSYFLVTDTIDFSNTEFAPVAYGTNIFQGIFDGDGKPFTNISYSQTTSSDTNRGLFGFVGANGVIKNVVLDSTSTIEAYSIVGGIVGYLYGTVSGCENKGTVNASGSSKAGGIVGAANAGAKITACTNSGTITAKSGIIGGILASTDDDAKVAIDSCTNVAAISSTTKVGGIAGEASVIVSHCENSGEISGSSTGIGGIVGYALAPTNVSTSANHANLVGSQNVGGIVGISDDHTVAEPLLIDSCYNDAAIDGAATSAAKGYVGGIGGYLKDGTYVSNSYNSGAIGTQYTTSTTYKSVAGIVGAITSTASVKSVISNCYNEGAISAYMNIGGICGYLSGDSTIVMNSHNLGNVTAYTSSSAYAGGISGNGPCHVLDSWNGGDISASGQYVGGILGYSTNKRLLCERNFNYGNVTTTSKSAGGIMGMGRPYIHSCYNFGSVTASENAGGLLGYPGNAAAETYRITFDKAYNAGTVTVTNGTNVGNILGYNASCKYLTITSCYYLEDVNGTYDNDTMYNESETYNTAGGVLPISHDDLCSLDLGDDFANEVATFPTLINQADNELNSFLVATVVFAEGDSLESVTKDFNVGTPYGAVWTSSDNVTIEGNNAKLCNTTAGEAGFVLLTVGENSKRWDFNITTVNAEPDSIGTDLTPDKFGDFVGEDGAQYIVDYWYAGENPTYSDYINNENVDIETGILMGGGNIDTNGYGGSVNITNQTALAMQNNISYENIADVDTVLCIRGGDFAQNAAAGISAAYTPATDTVYHNYDFVGKPLATTGSKVRARIVYSIVANNGYQTAADADGFGIIINSQNPANGNVVQDSLTVGSEETKVVQAGGYFSPALFAGKDGYWDSSKWYVCEFDFEPSFTYYRMVLGINNDTSTGQSVNHKTNFRNYSLLIREITFTVVDDTYDAPYVGYLETDDNTGIDDVTSDAAFTVSGRELTFGEDGDVYSISGIHVAHVTAGQSISLDYGIYIVRTGSQAAKVAIK